MLYFIFNEYFFISSAVKYIQQSKNVVIEGELRCAELSKYLEKMDAPRTVWLSEDASGITPKVCYHSSTGQLVGLVLPFDSTSGMPIPFTFVPRSVNEIADQMLKPSCTLIYLVMAQPIKEGVPPFILQAFGTDNSFTAHDMFQRWNHIKNELAKYVYKSRYKL